MKTKQTSYLTILDENGKDIFEIKANGEVWWLNKTFVKADTDKKLGKALGKALTTLVEMNKASEK